MQIAWNQLSQDALRALIEEFVTREGTEYGATDIPLHHKVAQIRAQLSAGAAVIVYDSRTGTCNIVPPREADSPD